MLFQLIEATREWLQDHPNESERTSPTINTTAATSSSSSASKICRFFKEGKCKFGEKCRFIHPENGASLAATERTTEKKTIESFDPSMIATKQPKISPAKNDKADKKKSVLPEPASGIGVIDKSKRKGTSKEDTGEKKTSMRQATEVISRILWDADLPTQEFCIGYLDRFVGIIEKPFAAFSWEDIASVGPNVLSVPKHRIQYFKYKDQIVWDKRSQLDNFFGSRGTSTIYDIVKRSVTGITQPQRDQVSDENEAVFDPELVSCNDDEPVPKTFDDKNRPTHFLCIRITDKQALSNIQKVQSHITHLSPQLADGCSPPTIFHVTLCMVRLTNEEHLATAKATLEKIKPQFLRLLPRCVNLILSGVDNFAYRLVYVKVTPNAALNKLVSFLIERLQMAGLSTPGNHSEYTPHVTIVKLSRPMRRELNAKIISPALYSPFQDSPIGHQNIQSLHLCPVMSPMQDDGFYLKLHTLTNSLGHLMPKLSVPLVEKVNMLRNQGAISEDEEAKLTEVFTISDNSAMDENKFEQALQVLTTRHVDRTKDGKSTIVIILRGVPGSGKSFIARNSSEYHNDPSRFAICSADDFFVKEGTYKFVPELTSDAHAHCLQLFLKALSEKEVVIVDNTNSQLWEYQIYCYICEILDLEVNILEIPCQSDFIADTYRARNVHNVDRTALSTTLQRWEEDKRATLVTPKISYPTRSASNSSFSLLALVQPESYQVHLLHCLPSLFAVYTGIFLTTESQWLLVSTYAPAFSNVFADHITLCFKPTPESIAATVIGKKVKVRVTGQVTDSGIQAVRIHVPNGVSFDVDHPHITISTDKNTSPRSSSIVLGKHLPSKSVKSLTLEGTIGLAVRELMDCDKISNSEQDQLIRSEAMKLPIYAVTSEKEFHQHIVNKLYPEISPALLGKSCSSDVSIYTGKGKITDLYLFDFDGTLFDSPEPKEGKALYKACTGNEWPHKGWWSCPESLLPPLEVLPGPAVADFRSHVGRARSITIILTSRIQRTVLPLKAILGHASIYPDRLILKPDNSKGVASHIFKGNVVRDLLKEFPDVTKIKFWDDKQDNLCEVDRIAKLTKQDVQVDLMPIEPPTAALADNIDLLSNDEAFNSFLETHLTSYAHLPSNSYSVAANTGIEFLSSQFAKVLEFDGDPSLLVYPFGSFPLGRRSDIDLCFIAPPAMSAIEFADKLATQLQMCGLTYLHVGHSSRCPRLMVRIEFSSTTSLDYDIVFAVLGESEVITQLPAQRLSAPEVQTKLKPSDSTSKIALSGPLFLYHVQEAIKESVSSSVFAAVVEMIVQIFGTRKQKGNAFHCIRTFHIVQLLADFVRSRNKATPSSECWNADRLFKDFVITSSQLPESKWAKLFGEFVPHQYIPEVIDTFAVMRTKVEADDFPTAKCYRILRSELPFPPAKHMTVQVRASSDNKVLLWKIHSVVEARLASYIRKILKSGIKVVPSGVIADESTYIFQFCVPDTEDSKQAIQQIFRPFWSEVAEYRQNDGTKIELLFGSLSSQAADKAGVASMLNSKESNAIGEMLTSFCSSDKQELHLSPSLNSYERLLVHELAERMSLEHKTIARDGSAHIVLRKSRNKTLTISDPCSYLVSSNLKLNTMK